MCVAALQYTAVYGVACSSVVHTHAPCGAEGVTRCAVAHHLALMVSRLAWRGAGSRVASREGCGEACGNWHCPCRACMIRAMKVEATSVKSVKHVRSPIDVVVLSINVYTPFPTPGISTTTFGSVTVLACMSSYRDRGDCTRIQIPGSRAVLTAL
jgi:hypothetical protein